METPATRGIAELNASFQALIDRMNALCLPWLHDECVQTMLAGPEPVVLLPDALLSSLPLEGIIMELVSCCPLF